MGENGSGKTTLSRHFIGLLKPSSGKIYLEGKDTTLVNIKSLAKDVGYVFQYPEHQFIADTVYDEIAYTPRLEKKSKSEIDRIVRETLNQVGLEGIDTRHPLSLSMGEKRRLSIATMLVRNPKMLILDEPTAGLDYRNTLRLMELLMGLKAKQTAIMLVTHTTFLVARYVQTVMVLEKGEMVFNGTPRDLFTHLDEVRTQSIDYPEMIKIVNEINKNQDRKMFPFLSVDELRSVLMPVKG
jgi:energy-coupling factor transport system ATP-binding protein